MAPIFPVHYDEEGVRPRISFSRFNMYTSIEGDGCSGGWLYQWSGVEGD